MIRKNDRRTPRRKTSVLKAEGIERVDWKDAQLLRKFISDRGKIRARRVTGLTPQQQKQVATAIKNAREMALLPYPGSGRS
ncbi:30S ribosomal protein S18 [Actinokineospora soli]|uniref:Small ribosomal subunit protein bS18 n=1 Tax=Actinokineospora soli TaxID=1048753 RepID=A0ABW2TID9_9PSEU